MTEYLMYRVKVRFMSSLLLATKRTHTTFLIVAVFLCVLQEVKAATSAGAVLAGNDPTAANKTLVLTEDNSIIILPGIFEFQDADGDSFSKIEVLSTVSVGTLTNDGITVTDNTDILFSELNAGDFIFTPAPNGNGENYTSFSYRVFDSAGESSITYTITFTVTSVNDLPTSQDVTVHIDEDTPKDDFNANDFLFTDSDGGTFTKIIITALDITGSFQLLSSDVTLNQEILVSEFDNLEYNPPADISGNGLAAFDYKIHDGTDYSTDSYTFTINVNPVDDPPTIGSVADPAAVFEDAGEQTIYISGISGGPNEPAPTVTISSSNPSLIPVTPASLNFNSVAGTAEVKYTPVGNQNGSATLTVSVYDGTTTVTEDWLVTVTAVNDEPNFITVGNQSTNEDVPIVVNLTGITPGPNETGQFITITASSGNTAVLGNGVVDYSQGSTANITFTPVLNASGTSIITLTLQDNGGTGIPGDDDTKSQTFEIEVISVNDPPTLADISSPAGINEDAGLQSLSLTGISDGDPDITQTVTVSAVSDNFNLIETVSVNYTQGNSTATLNYTPKANAFGTATITVTVSDGALNVQKTFDVLVNPINDPPTLDAIANPVDINEDATEQTVELSGITPGPNEAGQTVSVSAVSDKPTIIANPTAVFNSGTGIWSIVYTPEPNQYGDVNITVTVTDSDPNTKSTSRSFLQKVLSVNDPPTLNTIQNININEDAGLQIVAFDGITDDGTIPKNITVTAISDDLSKIQNPVVSYTSPNTSGSLSFTPNANVFGTINITVKVTDKEALFTEKTFAVNISNVNDPPTLNDIPAQSAIFEDAGNQSITLTGITAGPNESQTLVIFAESDNPTLISNQSAVINGTSGTLSFSSNANANGTATLTVRVDDEQSENNTIEKNVLITVLPINDAPEFDIPTIHAVSENAGAQSVPGFADNIDDGDLETQGMSIQSVLGTPSSNLTFVTPPTINLATGELTFETSPNTNGTVTVDVTLSDDGGNANGGINQTTKSFDLVVTSVNEPPTFILNGNPPAVNEDAGLISAANFAQNIDDGDPETVQDMVFEISQTSGTLTFAQPPAIDVSTGELSYLVNDNIYGTATFNVILKETLSSKESQIAQFTVTVNAVNDPPSGADGDLTTSEDEPYTFSSGDFTFSDIDGHGFNGIQVISTPNNGELLYNGSPVSVGTAYGNVSLLVYSPNENFNGSDLFSFKVRDASNDLSLSSYDMDITVDAVLDDPTGGSAEINTPEDQDYTFSIADFPYSDGDGESFAGIIIESDVNKGNLFYNNSEIATFPAPIDDITKLEFRPAAGKNGTPYTSFTFNVKDAGGATSASDGPYTMTINVGAVNDPPEGADSFVDISEDETYSFIAANFPFSDADGDTFAGIQITEIESQGTLKYNGTDVSAQDICPDVTLLNYTPPLNKNGAALATFKFKIKDNSSSLNTSIGSYTMTINVLAVNDAPVFSVTEDPPAINEDAGAQSVPSFISSIDDGDSELIQSLSFNLSYTLPATLSFTAAPSIDVTSGNLTFTPAPNAYGSMVVTVVLSDNGGTTNGGVDESVSQQFTLTVNPVNDIPTLADISGTYTVNEDASSFNVNLSGISAGPNETQNITVSAVSSNTAIIPNPTAIYTSPNNSGQLTITPVGNASGIVDITVTVKDDQLTNNSISKVFQVTVNEVNDPPSLNAIADPSPVNEDAAEQTVNLSGISAGPNESQPLTLEVTSNNETLIPTASIIKNYNSPDAIGSIKYTPQPNKSGTAEITVTVRDNGAANNSISRKFNVVVLDINDQPTLDDLPGAPLIINEDASQQSLTLTGISAGGGESQTLTISAVSDAPGIIPNPTVGPLTGGEAILRFTPAANKFGTVKITVTVNDGQSSNNTVSKSFFVNVQSVNDLPTLNAIANPAAINEDAAQQTIILSGISSGPGENQTISITAASDHTELIPDPVVNYTQGNATGSLSYTPVSNKFGTAVITVTVDDLSSTNNMVSRTFTVTVNSVNDFPTINDIISPGDINEDAPPQTVALSGITGGPGENQTVTVTAISLNPGIIGNPTVNYSGNNNATLLFTPVANANGTATIEVSVNDGQSVNNITKKTFTINVLKVNDAPTLDPIASPYQMNEDGGTKTIVLTGIGAGPNETEQTITISTVSDNTGLIPNPVISNGSGSSRNLIFTPVANKNGSANITVTVNDGQSTNNTVSRSFRIDVAAVNDPPSFDLSPDINITENSGPQIISGFAYNIDDNDPEITQGLSFEVNVTGGVSFNTLPSLSAANGDLVFEPAQNSNGTATVTVILHDDGAPSASSISKSFDINVLAVNGAPSFTLNGNPANTQEDAGTITVAAFAQNIDDGDPEISQPLTFYLNKISGDLIFDTNPQINAANGNLTYRAAANSNGTAVFGVVLKDGPGAESSTRYFNITVDKVNDSPVGNNETVSTNEDTPYTFKTGDFNYTDVESDPFGGIQIIEIESAGDMEYDGTDVILNQICSDVSLLVYKPDFNDNGNASFIFKVLDSKGALSTEYTMTISIIPINDAPSTAPGEINTPEDTPYIFSESDFEFSDPDGDSFAGISIFSIENKGDLEYDGNDVIAGTEVSDFGKLVFTPVPGENGSPYTSFKFRVKDSNNTYSVENTMTILVGATNDRPTGNNESVTILEDNAYTFKNSDFTFNDIDGDGFDGIRIESLETEGDLEYNGNDILNLPQVCQDLTKLVFKPNKDENGNNYASFTFKIKDNSSSQNLSSANYTMTINVTAVNDRPVFTISGNPPAVNEDAGSQSIPGFASSINDGDPYPVTDQALNFPDPTLVGSPTGNLSFSSMPKIDLTGTLTYRPAPNTYGTATFSSILKDNGGTANGGFDESIPRNFTVTVNSVNDLPTINAVANRPAILEDAGEQTVNLSNITAGPMESQTITVTAVSSNTSLIPNPTVIYTSPNTTGTLRYLPNANQSGTSTITITVSDGSATNGNITEDFTVTVTPVNDPPTLNDIPDPSPVVENSGLQTVNLSGITAGGGESQSLTLTVSSGNTGLIPAPTVSYNNGTTAQISYTPNPNENGESIISVTVEDEAGAKTVKTFKVLVTTVNDPPTLDPIADPAPLAEDAGQQQVIITGISAGQNEIQSLNFSVLSSNETLISDISIEYTDGNTDANVIYSPNENQFGTAILTVIVDDGGAIDNITSQAFTVTVLPVADQPTVSNASTDEGVQTTQGLVIGRNENDGQEVTYFKITEITNGKLYLQNGITEIINNEYITFENAELGLRFTPDSDLDGSFKVQSALSDSDADLGGEPAQAFIYINSLPTTADLPDLAPEEDSPQIIFDLFQYFEDKEDLDIELTFSITNTAENIVSANISGNLFTIDFMPDAYGIVYLTVKCTDTKGGFVEDEMVLDVKPVNDPPYFVSSPVNTGSQDIEYNYQIETDDPEADQRSFELLGPEWLYLVDNGDGTATLSGTPQEEDNGINAVEIVVTENISGLWESQTFDIEVNNVNDPPQIISEAPGGVLENQKYEYIIEVFDPDADDTYTVMVDPSTKPDWLELFTSPYRLEGFAPLGSSGTIYTITIFAIDGDGLVAEQQFTVEVSSPNTLPVIMNLNEITIEEDNSYNFSAAEFKTAFSDADQNDSLTFIMITELPGNGKLFLKGKEINESDTLYIQDLDQLVYKPDENFNNLNFFMWTASDGKSTAIAPARADILITPVDDPPVIDNMESDDLNYAFGDYNVFVTQTAEVKEVDDGRIASATFSITSNYLKSQDSLSIDMFDGISSHWNDTTGVLTITGVKRAEIYRDILHSLIYTNEKRFAPDTKTRTIELIVSDGDYSSDPVYRDINFEDTFTELIIPSGFTPNNDGPNDYWEIEYINSHEDALVRVYSRSGDLLYESLGFYKPWDGYFKGKLLNPGVYYYTIEIKKYERKYSGTITILR